jgi:hypothetical protein
MLPPPHSSTSRNGFSELWAAAVASYETNTKRRIEDFSKEWINVRTTDQVLKLIDQRQNDFKSYRAKGAKIRKVFKPVADCVSVLASIADECLSSVSVLNFFRRYSVQ